jgi:hypothetical protein
MAEAAVAAVPVSAPLPAVGAPGAGADNNSPSAAADFDTYFNDEAKPTPEQAAGQNQPADKNGDPVGKPAAQPVKEVPIKPEAAGSGKPKEEAKPDDGTAPKGDKPEQSGPKEAKAGQADKKPRETPWQIIHRLEKERDDYKRQIEGKPNGEHPELKTLKETLAEREKRLSDLETKLKYADYSQSDEYKSKYETPFVDAYISGQNKTASLTVRGPDDTTRKGTKEDFDTIMGIGNDDQAAEAATEMFGSKAPLVLYHREKVMELNAAKTKALDEYRTKGSEQEKTTREQTEKQRGEITTQLETFWKKHVEAPREKYASYGKPVDGDEQGNKLLQDGYARAEQAFANLNPFDPKLSPEAREKLVALHGQTLNKAAWFDRLAYQKRAADARVKELEAKVAEYEASEPGAGSGKRGKEKAEQSWEDLLETKYAK